MTIDWSATGEMITGLGTWVGAAAVAGAALIGRSTFASWRRQKTEERRMEVAEKILTVAYELRSQLESARSPFNPAAELRAAEELLAADPKSGWGDLDERAKERFKLAQCTLTRLSSGSDQWQKLWEVKPMALAYFGEGVEQQLMVFWKQYNRVRVSAQMYAQDNGRNEVFSRKLRNDLWGIGDEGDEISENVKSATEALELELLPILRQSNVPAQSGNGVVAAVLRKIGLSKNKEEAR